MATGPTRADRPGRVAGGVGAAGRGWRQPGSRLARREGGLRAEHEAPRRRAAAVERLPSLARTEGRSCEHFAAVAEVRVRARREGLPQSARLCLSVTVSDSAGPAAAPAERKRIANGLERSRTEHREEHPLSRLSGPCPAFKLPAMPGPGPARFANCLRLSGAIRRHGDTVHPGCGPGTVTGSTPAPPVNARPTAGGGPSQPVLGRPVPPPAAAPFPPPPPPKLRPKFRQIPLSQPVKSAQNKIHGARPPVCHSRSAGC